MSEPEQPDCCGDWCRNVGKGGQLLQKLNIAVTVCDPLRAENEGICYHTT